MQSSNARLLSSGGFGHLNDLNFNNSVFIAQSKACSVFGVEQVRAIYPLQLSR